MKTSVEVKSGMRSGAGVRTRQKVMEKSKNHYKRHLAGILGQARPTTSQQLRALDILTREGVRADGFPLIAAEAARLSHYKPRRAIAGPEICSALRALYWPRA